MTKSKMRRSCRVSAVSPAYSKDYSKDDSLARAARAMKQCARGLEHATSAVPGGQRLNVQTSRGTRDSALATTCEKLESRQLMSTTWYVSRAGLDSNAGSTDAPFKTVQAAADVAAPGDTVLIHAGTYRETVTPAHSGGSGAPIAYQPYGDGTVTISGADVISGWQQSNGSIFTTYNDFWDLGEGNNQVFVDGQMINAARWPNTSLDLSHPTLASASANSAQIVRMGQWTTATLRDRKLDQPAGFWDGATIDILPGQAWVAQTGTVISSSPGRLTYRYQQMNVPYTRPSAGDRFYLFGAPGALDSAGEWYRDPRTGNLSLWAPGGQNPNGHGVEVKRRQDAFNLADRSYIDIQGISLFAATIETNSHSNGIQLNGLDAKYVSQFTLDSSGWNEPAITGIQLRGSNSLLENSVIQYSAGNGVYLNGSNNTVSNCIIHDVDYTATSCSGIEVNGPSMHLIGNTIYNAGRDGIILSHSKYTSVLRNLVHDVMLQTTDGGGIYTYGTDGTGSEIAYNRVYNIHSGGYGAAGIYLDNFSNHYRVDHNVVSNCDWALKLNPPSHDNTFQENVLADSGAPLESSGSRDMSGTVFAGNIYNGALTLGKGVTATGNVYRAAPGLGAPGNAGADVPGWAITPAPTPSPTPVVGTPPPSPTPGGSNAGGVTDVLQAIDRAFSIWHKTHRHMSRHHTDFFVFTHPDHRYN